MIQQAVEALIRILAVAISDSVVERVVEHAERQTEELALRLDRLALRLDGMIGRCDILDDLSGRVSKPDYE